jgi:hypothetical protein
MAASDSDAERRRAKGAQYLAQIMAKGGAKPVAARERKDFFEPRPSDYGGATSLGGGGLATPRLGALRAATFVRGRGVAALVDPDVLAMGSMLEVSSSFGLPSLR